MLVDINRQNLAQTVLVLEGKAGALYLWSKDLARWRLLAPAAATAIDFHGEKYYPLSAIADVSHEYNPQELTLMIEVRPDAFARTSREAAGGGIPPPVRSGPGGFLNYDLNFSHSPGNTQRAGLFELGYFNRHGVGIGNILAENLGSHVRLTRLDTTWTVDYPDKRQTLRLGDAINEPGSWGRSVRFGGIQFGTNFSTQPAFVTFPPQSATGQAVLPSTVDVFVNNALITRQNVPPGPFSISNLPVINGAGEVQLVMTDLLGRQQIVTRPFYGSQDLLAKGLEDFSYEFGVARQNFGIASNDYRGWLGSGTYRRGISERFTGEVRAEAMPGQAALGAGGAWLAPGTGTINAHLAGSHSRAGNGHTAMVGFDRQAQSWSFGARRQWTSSGFTQVGQPAAQLPPAQVSSLNLSYAGSHAGAISFAYLSQHNRGAADSRLATMSYSLSLGRFGSLSVAAVRDLTGESGTTVFALLSIPLGSTASVSLGAQSVRGGSGASRTDFTTTLQRNLPSGEGYGYRIQARDDGATEASLALQNNVGTYTAGAARVAGATTTRLGATGGVAMLGGDLFPSRRIDQSFAVARIPDYPNVRMLTDNQYAGRTDARGNALIPRLRAYDRNVISIDQRDLPLDAEIRTLNLEAVPYFRSGIDVRFPIRHSRAATLTILLEDGTPMPIGATVTASGSDTVFVVGYEGEVYVAGLGASTRLRATWRNQYCEFDVALAPGKDPLPDLGTFICKGVKP